MSRTHSAQDASAEALLDLLRRRGVGVGEEVHVVAEGSPLLAVSRSDDHGVVDRH